MVNIMVTILFFLNRNPLLEGKFVNESNKDDDPATKNQNASCGKGYQQGSLLCAACASNFSHSGLGQLRCTDE